MITPQRIKAIEDIICRAANVLPEHIYDRERTPALVDARHAVWYVAHHCLGYSYSRLAKIYQRDHTTVRYGVMRMRKSAASTQILEAIKEYYPEALDRGPGPEEPWTVENWRFAPKQ
jgi:chromosomal replication initiation ATPase DnaA